ncbi:MAG TPA: response regulator [Fibrobacteria bacterium]|nr:response regulator [Fibrobacteria bacterium]
MKRSVVIVDDSQFLQGAIRDFFQQGQIGDYEVVAVGSNGAHAVELYRRHKPDLLTLDLTMPVKDGKTALTEIRQEFPDARILVISALSGPAVLECMKLGAKGYVEKPLLFDDEEFCKDFAQTLEEAFAVRPG